MTVLAADASRSRDVLECLAVPPEDVAGVVRCLDRLQVLAEGGPRGADDGLACFNHLYREITREVLDQLTAGDRFRDPEFLARLDVEFARRYFAAVRADAAGAPAPRSWRILLDRRGDERIGPVEFAVAGVNAHVNHDLAMAVVQTATVLGRPGLGPTEHADYRAINQIFAEHMAGLREHFESWLERTLDGALIDRILDDTGSLGVVLARDAAWRRAEHLWTLRCRPAEYEQECVALDWRAAMIGRGILSDLF